MKRLKYIIVTGFLLTTYLGSAQIQNAEFGLMGGLNISNITNLPQGVSSSSATGFHVGGFMNFHLSNSFDIQPGIIYTQLGGTITETESGQDSVSTGTQTYLANVTITQSSKIVYGYFQIPVNLVHKFGDGWNLHFGAYIGLLLTDKENAVGLETISIPGIGSQTANADTTTNSTVGDNRIDFGLNLGIGYTLHNGLGINFTYTFGVTNIIQAQSGYDPISGQYSTNPAFGSNVVYAFTLTYLLK